jgi:hypothetical protein
MPRLLSWITAASLLAVVMVLPSPETRAAAKAAPAPKPQQLNCSVVSCDEKVLVVRIKKGEEIKLSITAETKFGEKGAIKSAADFKPGNHVHITYVRNRGERVLKQIVHVVKHIN